LLSLAFCCGSARPEAQKERCCTEPTGAVYLPRLDRAGFQAGVKADEGTLLLLGDLNFRCELLTDAESKKKGGKDWEAVL
jgi:hypothetical protein